MVMFRFSPSRVERADAHVFRTSSFVLLLTLLKNKFECTKDRRKMAVDVVVLLKMCGGDLVDL